MKFGLYVLPGLAFSSVLMGGMGNMPASPTLPFAFVENLGQADPHVLYIGNGPNFKASFRESGVEFQRGSAHAKMRFVGGASHPRMEVSEPISGKANYLLGQDRHRWLTDLPLFNELEYHGVWPGVEIKFKADSAQTKAEYVVAPGTPVSRIRIHFDGRASVEPDGSLVVSTETGQFREAKPYLFQGEGLQKAEVEGAFLITDDGSIGFSTGKYDPSKPLVVDPTILFSGYFGGASQTTITGVAVNSYYNVVVTGWTLASDLPAVNTAQVRSGGNIDAFVAAFSPAGGGLIYCTYLGGSGADEATGIAVDASNNTYLTGWTSSPNFPVANALQAHLSGARDAFVAKLTADGTGIFYSTYLGGSGADSANSIVLDSSNAAILAGDTTSTNLPVTTGVFQRRLAGGQDTFVAKLSPSGSTLSFLTYFGGNAADHVSSVKVDGSNAIYFGGSTYSTNLPVLHPAQAQSGGGQDGFIAKLSPDASTLSFSSYIGGSGGTAGAPEEVNAIAVPLGSTLVAAGTTSSTNFPTTATALQKTFGGGNTDGFIVRINLTTGALIQSTYLGGSLDDGINAMANDWEGFLYVAGYTTSPDLQLQRPVQNVSGGSMDAFVAKLSPVKILFGTYLGGNGNDSANAIAIDSRTSIVVTGTTGSGNFPVSGNAASWQGSALSAFIAKFSPNFHLAVVAPPLFFFDVWANTGYNGPNVTLNESSFGAAGDIPVVGDWTGNGTKRIGVFRNGAWLLDINNDGVFDAGDLTVSFGQTGDIPVVGDWTGSGAVKLGLFRNGTFILDLSGHLSGLTTGISDAVFTFGLAGDIPIAADWNNSGTTKVGVFRNGTWLVDYNGSQTVAAAQTYTYGQSGDIPVTGDWDSSGKTKIGIYRHGTWMLNYPGTNVVTAAGVYEMYLGFGGPGYTPLSY